jgi:hypothetical protein
LAAADYLLVQGDPTNFAGENAASRAISIAGELGNFSARNSSMRMGGRGCYKKTATGSRLLASAARIARRFSRQTNMAKTK